MKEDIMLDLSNLLDIVRNCKQEFRNWVSLVNIKSELSMHFNSMANDYHRLFLMDMHKGLNRSQSDKCTFWRIFSRQEAKEYEENAITSTDIAKWRNMLSRHDTTINMIKITRDTQIVHTDKDAPVPELISMWSLQKLLYDMENVIKNMFMVLGKHLPVIAIIEDVDNHTIAEAFNRLEVMLRFKQLSRNLGLEYSDPV
ncbi:hypothetical protein [Chitinophaga niabensis]|uniref:HEPN AbiU2-like domain-containing protein n=1 Tax=Chitinophaga niabensis TaxID=536979 RepID=A0A1N6JZF7_9BACT|nr:hypothetical protein [Chitinophaga niabensis]SIO49436.1 hypothetical protein SAMN04488055_4713 [Chitinophaga niabensis]